MTLNCEFTNICKAEFGTNLVKKTISNKKAATNLDTLYNSLEMSVIFKHGSQAGTITSSFLLDFTIDEWPMEHNKTASDSSYLIKTSAISLPNRFNDKNVSSTDSTIRTVSL